MYDGQGRKGFGGSISLNVAPKRRATINAYRKKMTNPYIREKILLYKIIFTYSPCLWRPFQIKDKGKSDWLAKPLVLLQTSWFVMQCIARAIEHFPVTHLKIVTFAYATMNFVI